MIKTPTLDAVLDDFAMEQSVTKEVYEAYLDRYPKYAEEITDLFHELFIMELEQEELANNDARLEVSANEAIKIALSGVNLRELSKSIEMPRSFLSGFLNRQIVAGTIPKPLIHRLAYLINVSVSDFISHLVEAPDTDGAFAFKSTQKPKIQEKMTYDDYVSQINLTDSQVRVLSTLVSDNEPD